MQTFALVVIQEVILKEVQMDSLLAMFVCQGVQAAVNYTSVRDVSNLLIGDNTVSMTVCVVLVTVIEMKVANLAAIMARIRYDWNIIAVMSAGYVVSHVPLALMNTIVKPVWMDTLGLIVKAAARAAKTAFVPRIMAVLADVLLDTFVLSKFPKFTVRNAQIIVKPVPAIGSVIAVAMDLMELHVNMTVDTVMLIYVIKLLGLASSIAYQISTSMT